MVRRRPLNGSPTKIGIEYRGRRISKCQVSEEEISLVCLYRRKKASVAGSQSGASWIIQD